MEFKPVHHFLTGTAVPVSALRSEESCGIGEFLDLIPFGSFCKKCGIELIQLLPINDTGDQKSPYSAVSAYALHPVYIRLQSLPGSEHLSAEILECKNRFENHPRLRFQEVLEAKLDICRRIYTQALPGLRDDTALSGWIRENPWVKPYSVYSALKAQFSRKHWNQWPEMQNPDPETIEAYWQNNTDTVLFYTWIQYHLELQLKQASDTLSSINIALKGDIPILMSEDSADVWVNRSYFRIESRAGAPPDMYSDEGQNWGFPIYHWEALERDDYTWWKNRLKQADKFFHAYRIDHVLGFFRIWTVPAFESSASMGYYIPYTYITRKQLKDAGFSDERIAWLSKAHIYAGEIRDYLQENAAEVLPYLQRIGNEDLFLFQQAIRGSADIDTLPISGTAKEAMKTWEKNRTLIRVDDNTFFPAWHHRRNRAYQTLSNEEKGMFETMIENAYTASEKTWEKHGEKLLSMLKKTTKMLVCAEDLGAVPQCVPKVLKKLNLLSLKIVFWAREYSQPAQPFIPPSAYPQRSVASLSVHDTVVFREWWEKISTEDEKKGFCSALGIDREIQSHYTPKLAELIISKFFNTSSSLCILQLQEFLSLDEKLRMDTEDERINTPGTVQEKNWTYRMPVSIESLITNEKLCSTIQKLTLRRGRLPVQP